MNSDFEFDRKHLQHSYNCKTRKIYVHTENQEEIDRFTELQMKLK